MLSQKVGLDFKKWNMENTVEVVATGPGARQKRRQSSILGGITTLQEFQEVYRHITRDWTDMRAVGVRPKFGSVTANVMFSNDTAFESQGYKGHMKQSYFCGLYS
jgi:hypothetical protein